MMLETLSYKHQLSLREGGEAMFIMPYQIEVEGGVVFADEVSFEGNRAQARFGESVINDYFTFEAGRIVVRRTWSLEGYFKARLGFSVMRRSGPRLAVIPGVEYRRLGRADEWHGEAAEGKCAVPSFLFLEDEDMYFAVFTQPGAAADEASRVRAHVSGSFCEAAIETPGEEPESGDKRRGGIQVNGHLSYERTFYVVFGKAGPRGLRQALEQAWEMLVFEPSPRADWSDAAGACTDALLDRFFIERGDAIGFVHSVTRRMLPVKPWLSGGGTGGNIAGARALYRVSKADGDLELKRRALDIADFFLDGVEERDDPRSEYRLGIRRWRREGYESDRSRELGNMFYDYLLLHRDTRRNGDHNTRWMRACRRWADDLVARVKAGGESPGNPAVCAEGASGPKTPPGVSSAYNILGLATLANYFQGSGYRLSAERLAARLMPLSVETSWVGGGLCRDDALAILRAFLLMNNLTGHREYLDAAEGVAGMLLSCTYCFNTRTPERSQLSRAGLHTLGGVIAFPRTRVLDSSAAAVALELLRLDAALGGGFWRRPALAQLEFASKLISSETTILSPWPGCVPARIDLETGEASGFESSALVTMLISLIELADEFPEVVRVQFAPAEHGRAKKRLFGRVAFYLGCLINRWA